MTNLERHMAGLALIAVTNVVAAFTALKTLDARLFEESQKAYSNAPQQQEIKAYEPYPDQQLAMVSPRLYSPAANVLSAHRTQVISE